MKKLWSVVLFVSLLAVSSLAFAHGGEFVANRVATPPTIDGKGDDAAWASGFRYPFAFNQLNEADQVWTNLDSLEASFRLVYHGNVLYGIVYRHDDHTHTTQQSPHLNDGVELFFDFTHEGKVVTQIRSIVGRPFAESVGGKRPEAVWSEDGTIFEFAIDLSAVGLELKPGLVIGFNIAINEADHGPRTVQLYPIPGNNRSYLDANALGHLVFR